MKLRINPRYISFISGSLLLVSCGTLRTVKLEKRLYNDGYHISYINSKKCNNSVSAKNIDVISKTDSKNSEKELFKKKTNKIVAPSYAKHLKKKKRNAAQKVLVNLKPKLSFQSSGPSSYKKKKRINIIAKKLQPSGLFAAIVLTTGLLVGIIIFTVFLLMGLNIILTILVAILFAIIIVYVLKALGVIDS